MYSNGINHYYLSEKPLNLLIFLKTHGSFDRVLAGVAISLNLDDYTILSFLLLDYPIDSVYAKITTLTLSFVITIIYSKWI